MSDLQRVRDDLARVRREYAFGPGVLELVTAVERLTDIMHGINERLDWLEARLDRTDTKTKTLERDR